MEHRTACLACATIIPMSIDWQKCASHARAHTHTHSNTSARHADSYGNVHRVYVCMICQTKIETIARKARKRPITGIKYNYSVHTQSVAAQFSYVMRAVFPLRLGGPCVCMIVFNIELLRSCMMYAWNGQMHAHVCEMSTCVYVQSSGFERHCARPN